MNNSFVHYYVQSQTEDGVIEIVAHSYNEDDNEYYHKFLDRKKAQKLAESEKDFNPNVKFRVVKCTETFDLGNWF